MVDTVEQAIYRLRAEGQEQVDRLKKSVDGLVVSEENLDKTNRTTSQTLQNRLARMDPLIRAQEQYRKELESAQRYAQAGVGTQAQQNAQIELATQRYNAQVTAIRAAEKATGAHAAATGLARHELINLSRQAQDVGVSLASGQSPLLVLAQQGSQIADVFASSGGTVRGFFGQAVGWAGRFVASTAGVITGLTGIGAAALYMGASFSSAQKDIDRALSGIGAASGVNRADINRIVGAASSPFGLSVSEAREAATAFAATGKIYGDNIRIATLLTKDFARATGVDASEATKTLAKDLSGDLVGAALKWNATLGFADGKTVDYIQSLVSMGQRQQAINALITAAAPAIGRMAENTSKWGLAWDFVANKASNAGDVIGRAVARGAERLTGQNFGGFDDQERLDRLRENRASRSGGQFALGLDAGAIRALDTEIARLEQRIADMAKQGERVRFAQMSLEARDFARSINEGTAQIERLSQGLAVIEQVQARRINSGNAVDPGLEKAAQMARVQLALALEQEQIEIRKAQVISQNALKYQDTSAAIANQRELMAAQLIVAQSITGVQEIAAQREAAIVQLKQQGLSLSDATAIADAQRAISLAQVNAEADRMLISLRQEGELIRASSEAEQDRIKARQTYQNLVNKGVDSTKAQMVASKQLQNAEESRAKAEQQASEQAIRSIRTRRDAWDAEGRGIISWSVANDEAGKVLRRQIEACEDAVWWYNKLAGSMFNAANAAVIAKNAFVPFSMHAVGEPDFPFNTQTWENRNGGTTQFNPSGYKIVTPIAGGSSINPSGITSDTDFDKILQQTGSVAGVVQKLLSEGLTTKGGGSFGAGGSFGGNATIDQEKVGLLNRAIDLLPQDLQKSIIPMAIAELQKAPQTLAGNEQIKSLTEKLAQLTTATEQNTAATAAMTDVLSPFYSTDPRRSHLGFRAFGGGGIMTPWGELPLHKYDGGGIASSPQVAVFGEGRTPEAYVPVPNGRIPVEMRQPANNNQKQTPSVVVNNHFHGPVTKEMADMLKRTGFQNAQQMKRALG